MIRIGKLVFLPQDIDSAGKEYLISQGYELLIGKGISEEDLIKGIEECDAMVVRMGNFNRKVLWAGKNLKFIARHGVGLDNIDLEACKELGIMVSNDPYSNINAVAEHTLSMILALSKNIVNFHNEFKENGFHVRNQICNIELKDKVLGIVGLGKIGKLIANKAYHGFGMSIRCYDKYLRTEDCEDYIQKVGSLEDLLKNSDFVSVNAPLTQETKNLFSKKEFSLMKKGSYFINVARGELMVESDLIDALKSNHLRGAALDVYNPEPPSPDNELLSLNSVILSPHNAALSIDAMRKMSLNAAYRIDEFFLGKQVENLVEL
ncbi:hydroxyacid dehydrogenase [Natronincola ferrireducens]|uniref:D-3-phosphoglycerate dehydrogenase n=1 Tax=Natronincola ferrireducens TaxID=393762 RepID=A0A1G9GEC1_9FIRM|nr:hydroxyacid dehydrogenase [Natronincola ferrireducens]SDK99019.1 D-3-phosphoglycerate dehydrogenase [Natronincola ferrireducens]